MVSLPILHLGVIFLVFSMADLLGLASFAGLQMQRDVHALSSKIALKIFYVYVD